MMTTPPRRAGKIEIDRHRFIQIVRGRIKRDLRKYISDPEILGRRGKNFVAVPVPQIELPHFSYGTGWRKGVGHGDGQVGDPLPGRNNGAGNAAAEHTLEVDITIRDLAEILGEELELPRIKPRGMKTVATERSRYASIRRVGPQALCDFRRTFKQALRRQIIAGEYDYDDPVVVPTPQDRRFRSWKVEIAPHASAVIIYMMDVSGSMGDEQKEIVRTTAFWIDAWLKSQYRNVQRRFIIHDAEAHIVDEHSFYHTRETGGTMISSAYTLCDNLIARHYPPSEWNIYPFHFSDGDNWEGQDTDLCIRMLRTSLLPKVNQFCYGQVESRYGSGDFIDAMRDAFEGDCRIASSEISEPADIPNVIREFLGKGR